MSYQQNSKRLCQKKSTKVSKVSSEKPNHSLSSSKSQVIRDLNSPSNRILHSYASKHQKKSKKSKIYRVPSAKFFRRKIKNAKSYHSSASSPNLFEMVKSVKKGRRSGYSEHLLQTFQALNFAKSLRQPSSEELQSKTLALPRRKGFENKKTVVFDLDETLVHCLESPQAGEYPIKVTFADGRQVSASINIRPYTREILASANTDFEVIVFTASHQCYADEVLNILDPTGELIHHRVYRESCLVVDGVHVKDLRIFADRKIEDIVIVDNATHSFAYQLFNGVPIISWYENPNDIELFKLMDYLKVLANAPDVRKVNKKTFRLDSFYRDYLNEMILSKEN